MLNSCVFLSAYSAFFVCICSAVFGDVGEQNAPRRSPEQGAT